MAFVIKGQVSDPAALVFEFRAAKTMYGGKHIAVGDTAFLFASGNDAGSGPLVYGVVTCVTSVAKLAGLGRQTPRVSVEIKPGSAPRRPLGRPELRGFTNWNDGRPETELNFKLYRQATDKIVGISNEAATFLAGFF